jgi:broad-specificity NMP kinase
MNPLTAMYEAWSKEGEDMRKFEDFLHYAEQQKAIDKRYNKKIVKQITDIDEEDLDEFIMFCKMDRMFILTAQEYDLAEEIKKCGDKFKEKKIKENTKLR